MVGAYTQVDSPSTVEANAAVAQNDVEFMAGNTAAIKKHYPATATDGTTSTTVKFVIRDADLNTVKTGSTTFNGPGAGNLAVAEASVFNLDAATNNNPVATAVDAETNALYVAADTALVPNTLNVTLGSANINNNIDAQNDTAGTFSLGGAINITNAAAGTVTASYSFNSIDTYAKSGAGNVKTKRAKVTSTSDTAGEWVQITEVASQAENAAAAMDSEYFKGSVSINSDASNAGTGNDVVWVQDGDTLTVTFYGACTDSDADNQCDDSEVGSVIASTTATIDDSSPSITNVSPADGILTSDTGPNLSFTISDTGSGFDSSIANFGDHVEVYIEDCIVADSELGVSSFSATSITVTYTPLVGVKYSQNAETNASAADAAIVCSEVDGGGNDGADRTKGGFEIDDTTLTADADLDRTNHGAIFSWYIKATDKAGNEKTLGDKNAGAASDLNIIIDASAPAALSPFVVAATAWNAADKKDVDDNSSIKLVFNESIDESTVTAADFTVSGTGVTSSTIESITFGGKDATKNTLIYLDLAADLGPNAKPKVALVGQIDDLAGNTLKPASGSSSLTLGTAVDGVKPTISDMVLTSNLLKDKGSATVSFSANENLTNTGASLATGCTCLSVFGGNASTAAMDGTDTTKVGLTLTTPTSGTKTLKESSTAPIANTQGIYGIVIAGRDSSSATNVGVGGVVKVTDEDVSKYFTTADDIDPGGDQVADATLDNDNEVIKIKLKNWPLADHDGDGDIRDSITGMTVEGASVNVGDTDSLYVSKVDWSEAETVSLKVGDLTGDADAIFGTTADTIAAGEKVKVTYYYVAASNVLEVDLTAPTLAASNPFSPEDSGSITDTTPSISVTWDEDEYAGDNYTTVTLNSATLKGPDGTVDVTDDMTTTDNKSFYYKPATALALGEYTFTVVATDTAGNKSSEQSAKWTLKARAKTEISMTPGWNLISLPGEPADNAINTVLTNQQIQTVLTYDPNVAGGWLTAVRDGDTLVGTLETVDSSHAYWVLTNNSDKIKVDIPGYTGGTAAVPPAISIVPGWNLVPAAIGSAATVDADKYFFGLDWTKAKAWTAASETWTDIFPGASADQAHLSAGATVAAGQGYWLFSNKYGTLVP